MERLSSDELKRIEWFDQNFKDVKENIKKACLTAERDESEIIVLAATKTVPARVINHAIKEGIAYIGENRVQEFLSKKDSLSKTVHRHFIGHLQTNKVKDIVGEVEMIHSVHSIKLAEEIDKQCAKLNKTMDVLIEVNIGNEESKSGFLSEEVCAAVEKIAEFQHIRVKGLMAIPPIEENNEKISQYFAEMRKLFIDIAAKKLDNVDIVYLSMGMSGDYTEAIKHGANIIRLGTCLFGARDYTKK